MNRGFSLFLFTCSLSTLLVSAQAQKLKKADKAIIQQLSSHVQYLSGDPSAGTSREKLAMEYLCAQFKKNGIEPKGDDGSYSRAFEIKEGMEIDADSYLFINGEEIKTDGYFPLLLSPRVSLEAAPSLALKETGEPWFIDLKEDLENQQDKPAFNIKSFIKEKTEEAAAKGATALFVYNTSNLKDGLAFDKNEKGTILPIPVIYIGASSAKKYFADEAAALEVKLKTGFVEKTRKGQNIIGFINNNAPNTIVIGTHESASNTAALIEIGSLLKSRRSKNNNYMLVAYLNKDTAYEASSADSADYAKVNFMIHMNDAGDAEKLQYIYTIIEKAK